ncbi:histidine kinase 3 [Wolffia australiana]
MQEKGSCRWRLARGWRSRLYNHYLGSKKLRETWWRKFLVLWVTGWGLLALWIFCFMNLQAAEKRKETLASMCDERASMLQDQFNVSMNHLQALAILISTFHHSKHPSAIDQATFAGYTERTAFERPLTSGVAYAVKVLHREREEFERRQGWSIKRMDAQDSATEAQEEYAPVIFAQDTIKHVVSLDMFSGKEDRDNVLRARESGRGVLTAPLRLIKSKRLGVILTFAVYKSELPSNASPRERIDAAIGYLGGVFDIEALVDKLLHQLACKHSIAVDVYDTTDPSYPISMYSANDTAVGDGMFHHSSLNFGDPLRRHEMHCRFTRKPPLPWIAVTTSIGTWVITLLVGYIFNATVNRIAKVEDDYRQMTELKKRAEMADIAKSQFLATVSHEIRTPMNGVLGMLQMLMDTDLDLTQQDFVRTAQASGKALVSLINEVLDQAKIESGKLELEAVRFDLRAVLDDVLSLFSGKSQEKGIELAVYVTDKVPEILIGDPGRMRQIITNLVGNSIKFTEKGHIFLTVHLLEEVTESVEGEDLNTLSGAPVADKKQVWQKFSKAHVETGSSFDSIHIVVSVEDTGVGIPLEAQSRVFTPFMQVGPSVSRIHGGTGIGLSICKCLVGLMKGEIGFVSVPRVGSTFSFTAALGQGRSNELRSLEFEGLRALVVDPRPVRAAFTKYQLCRLGIIVDMVSDLGEAISFLTKVDLSIVLVEKEEWLRDSGRFQQNSLLKNSTCPKIFILANPSNSSKVSSLESSEGEPAVIIKPLRASILAVALQQMMGSRAGVKEDSNHRGRGSSLPSLSGLLLGKSILVVDDNVVNLRVAAGALKKYGAEVICADSGKKAIALLQPPHKFDACFMDIQMPEMDGFEATKRIREMEKEADGQWHIPILAMTADVIQATHEACIKSGMDGYVSKPFEGEQLYREVARFFKNPGKENQ